MMEKMRRFLSSLGIADPERFDMDFEMVGRDPADRNIVNMTIRKETPWESASLEEFQEAIASIRYAYNLRFSYEKAPSVNDVEELFEGWYLAMYHGIAPLSFVSDGGGRIHPQIHEGADASDVGSILRDFAGLLRFLTYPFLIVEKKENAPVSEPKAEETSPTMKPSDGDTPSTDEPMSDEEKESQAEVEAAQAQYLAAAERQKANDLYRGANRRGEYLKLHSIEEIYSLPSGNVEFAGRCFESTVKLGRKGLPTGAYGIGDERSAVAVRAFAGGRSGLSNESVNSVKVGSYVRIRGYIQPDKFTGEPIVMCQFIDLLSAPPLRSDPEVAKRVELHLHTNMSAMDGIGDPAEYCALAKNMGMSAIAVTDHGDIQSFPAMQKACKDNGLKPIYGCEFYMFDPTPEYVYNPCDLLLSKARYCVLDTETTGLSSHYDRITEFGGVIVENGQVVSRFDQLVNPGVHIPDKITAKTHISDDMVKDKPLMKDCIRKICDFIGDAIIVSHNASFDIGFLDAARERAGLPPLTNPAVDTLALSHFLFPEASSHRLGSLSRRLGLSTYNDDDAHRADFDAEALNAVWEAILAKLNPRGDKRHCDLKDLEVNKTWFPKLSDGQLTDVRSMFYQHLHSSHMIALVKNAEGLREMYRLISLSNTDYMGSDNLPKIPRSELEKGHRNLLFGSACFNSDVFEMAKTRSYEDLKKAISFYDYVEIQPLENYSYLINIGDFDKERLLDMLKTIMRAADELHKPIVATGDVHYVNPEDKVCRDVYIFGKLLGGGRHPLNPNFRDRLPLFDNPDQHFRSTKEMLDSFSSWLPEGKAREIVVKNTNLIADMVEPVYPVKPDIFPPNANLPDSAARIKDICYANLKKHYGDNPDPLIKERLDKELAGVIGHGYSVTYYIAHCIIKKANEDGYFIGSRGSVGSSFAATMADITEVNPLPPHYVCPKCHHFEWSKDPSVHSGFDLPDKVCPECGEKMLANGQNIPFEVFLGFHAEKVPDIDLNFPPDYQAKAHDYTRTLLGPRNCFRAGTISTVAQKTAYGMVRGYYERIGKDPDGIPRSQIAKIATRCTGVKRTTGQHPGGIVVIPSDMNVFDFTPFQHPADDLHSDWLTTHYEFASMHDEVLKLDLLGHVDPLAIRKMCAASSVDMMSIPMNDKKVLSLFSSPAELKMSDNPLHFETGAVAMPEFGTSFVQGILAESRPKTFNDLLIISGLSHGTDVWNNNAEDLIRSKTATLEEVIGCRDDIMTYLIAHGIDNSKAFKIMEYVRKNKVGKPLREEDIAEMKAHNVPDYYINSCKKIRYLFPRAHATAYVIDAVRVAWFKLYHPLEFYAVYFSVRCDNYDLSVMKGDVKGVLDRLEEYKRRENNRADPLSNKEVEIQKVLTVEVEMLERGFTMGNIDLYRSQADDFVVDHERKMLIPPFKVISGLGAQAGETVVEARKKGPFISKEDLCNRTKLSETNIKDLSDLGALGDLGETNQMSLFDFVK
ncbi:MAG: PolC-type DNA polymerase III [Bacilli bacterium]|jgi:DNA polymerase-3 subunit alpha (Gram-positive type)|nr:PolC-type DNA polymerase III [Bacilli bacterium]